MSERTVNTIQLGGPRMGVSQARNAAATSSNVADVFGALRESFGRFANRSIDRTMRSESVLHQIKLTELAETRAEEARTARFNDEQKRRLLMEETQARARAGLPATEEEMSDLDRMTAYKKVSGSRAGRELSGQFKADLNALGPGQDIDAFTEAWLARNLNDGAGGVGTGDILFDGALLGTFHDATVESRTAYTSRSFVAATNGSIAQKSEEIALRGADGTPGDFRSDVAELRALDPMNAHEAIPKVMSMWVSAAGKDPHRLAALETLFDDPAAGDGTHTLRTLFPEAVMRLETKGVNDYMHAQTLAGQLAYNAIREELQVATQPAHMAAVFDRLDAAHQVHGVQGDYNAIRSQAVSKLQSLAATEAEFNSVGAMMNGTLTLDASLVAKHFTTVLDRAGLDFKEKPAEVADMIYRAKGQTGADFRALVTAAMSRPGDTASYAAALTMLDRYRNLSGGNSDMALNQVDGAVHHDTLMALRQLDEGRTPEAIAFDLQASRERASKARDVTWTDLGTDVATVTAAADKAALAQLEYPLPPYLRSRVLDEARALTVTRGDGDYAAAIKDAIQVTGRRLRPIPGLDGKLRATEFNMPGDTIHFGKAVLNPDTGNTENTLRTFNEDLTFAVGFLQDGDTDNFGVAYNPAMAVQGLYAVIGPDSMPVRFAPGDTVQLGGETYVIPTDRDAARTMLAGIDLSAAPVVPSRGELSPNQIDPGPPSRTGINDRVTLFYHDGVYHLGYKPGFKEAPLPTVEQLAGR